MNQAHKIPGIPSSARTPHHPGPRDWTEPLRADPGYDMPGPIRRSDLSWQLVAEGAVVFVAIVMFVVLASLVDVR